MVSPCVNSTSTYLATEISTSRCFTVGNGIRKQAYLQARPEVGRVEGAYYAAQRSLYLKKNASIEPRLAG